jgi:hypothetical protein
MTKTVYTLNVENYNPDITALTYPLLKRWAQKIGAAFHVITERKFPYWPPVMEKLQLFDLGKQHKNDWNIYIDSDALVHPDFFDPTDYIQKDMVLHNGADFAGHRWSYDEYFRRDGRHISSCNWFAVASDWCLDLWHPPENLTLEDALARIHPTVEELSTVITADHLIDDYLLSRNIARFGLKFKTVLTLTEEIKAPGNYLWHQYVLKEPEKIEQMKMVLRDWKLG